MSVMDLHSRRPSGLYLCVCVFVCLRERSEWYRRTTLGYGLQQPHAASWDMSPAWDVQNGIFQPTHSEYLRSDLAYISDASNTLPSFWPCRATKIGHVKVRTNCFAYNPHRTCLSCFASHPEERSSATHRTTHYCHPQTRRWERNVSENVRTVLYELGCLSVHVLGRIRHVEYVKVFVQWYCGFGILINMCLIRWTLKILKPFLYVERSRRTLMLFSPYPRSCISKNPDRNPDIARIIPTVPSTHQSLLLLFLFYIEKDRRGEWKRTISRFRFQRNGFAIVEIVSYVETIRVLRMLNFLLSCIHTHTK